MSNHTERRRNKRIDFYDHSLLSDEIKHSLVIDISDDGACLLMEKSNSFFLNKKDVEPVVSDNVHLTIFHPDSHIDDGLKINAEIVWVNPDYSSDHHKVGLKFLEINEEQVSYINRMIKWLSTEGHYFFHCDLEKR